MEKIFLVETKNDRKNLLPLTYFNKISNILTGLMTVKEKWQVETGKNVLTNDVFFDSFPGLLSGLLIRSAVLPDSRLVRAVTALKKYEVLTDTQGRWIAVNAPEGISESVLESGGFPGDFQRISYGHTYTFLQYPWDLIFVNAEEIRADFLRLKCTGNNIPSTVKIVGDYDFCIHPTARLEDVFLDLTEGPVYIGRDVKVLPFTFIKGPAVVLNHSLIKAGTRIYNGTTLGPWTKVGGEIKNVLFFGYSNKGHDGFLGDAVVGKWVNFGAGTSNSNLKNNYSSIRMWSVARGRFVDTGRMFAGLVMGDYSKTAVNTRLNTGTVVGVSSNIFTGDFPPKFVNSFNWGGKELSRNYLIDKAIDTARTVWKRRGLIFDRQAEKRFEQVYEFSASWEKINPNV
jgi:UDP-N-acetylglucosamine diphosphorylase/glucosamine-1-phosphate N-acetyltransferase